jgi:hypothetical protein
VVSDVLALSSCVPSVDIYNCLPYQELLHLSFNCHLTQAGFLLVSGK